MGGALARRYDALIAEAREGSAPAARRAAAMALDRDALMAEEALALAISLDPLDGVSRLALAQLQADRGDLTAARAEAARAFSGAVDQSAKALAAFALGEIALSRGDSTEARDAFSAARAMFDVLLSAAPADYDALRHFARACQRLADLPPEKDGPEKVGAQKAHDQHAAAFAVLEGLAMREDAHLDLAEDLAHGCARLASLSRDLNAPDAARRYANARIGWVTRLADEEPQHIMWRFDLAEAWEARASLDAEAGRLADAREASDAALKLRLSLAAAAPHDVKRRDQLADAWTRVAVCAAHMRDFKAARPAAAQARALHEEAPENARALYDALSLEGDIALHDLDAEAARISFAHAAAIVQPLARADEAWLPELARTWERLGDVGIVGQRFDSARDAFARARAFLPKADPRLDARLALKLGEAALGARDMANAKEALSHACKVRVKLVQDMPSDQTLIRELAVALERLGLIAQAMGDEEAARQAWTDELQLADRLRAKAPNDEHTLRFCAVIHAHLATLRGGEKHRAAAFALLTQLADMGKLSETDISMRARMFGEVGR
ncbi:MAG: hypothetical protein AB7O04_02185 [Hyphomonadaceae bacterium]